MFPFIYGFEWTPGHMIFTGVFLAVAVVVAATVLLALMRSAGVMRRGEAGQTAWQSTFHDLPEGDRLCRHALTGELEQRICERGFDCRQCSTHARLGETSPSASAGRLYHRGHTWVRPAGGGELLIGLDDIATRLLGPLDSAELPSAGTRLETNTPAFTVRKNGVAFRILSPADGTVLESGDSRQGWFARVRPAEGYSDAHLLRGYEAAAWFQREVERIQLAACAPGEQPALADGGVLVDDVSAVLPEDRWEAACAEILLDS